MVQIPTEFHVPPYSGYILREQFRLRVVPLRRTFPGRFVYPFLCNCSRMFITPRGKPLVWAMFRFAAATQEIAFAFLRVLRCFSSLSVFTMYSDMIPYHYATVGFIRKSSDQSLLTAPEGLAP